MNGMNITDAIDKTKKLLDSDKAISPSLKAMVEVLLVIVSLLLQRLGLNSSNSSKPPSSDPNRDKTAKANPDKKKPGGQKGHVGKNLKTFEHPDKIVNIAVDLSLLPKGGGNGNGNGNGSSGSSGSNGSPSSDYKEVGYESRQVVDIEISRIVTEYRAQIIEDKNGKRYTATFPEEVKYNVQYGQTIKSHAVYMSQFQLLPYNRIEDYFADQMAIPISAGSIFNFNKEAYDLLESFEEIAKEQLKTSNLINADETSINIGGKRMWLHSASNDLWVHFYPHQKRGSEAMNDIGILPYFKGVLCHDHWKAYYQYTDCKHALCNAHHLRELEAVVQFDKHRWAKDLQDLLCQINKEKQKNGRALSKEVALHYRLEYRRILKEGEKESKEPPPTFNKNGSIKKNPKKEKHRNLLERLRDFEDDTLRFMETDFVPFTNNRGENDIRMTKVQQKISGCFRSIEGAKIFCRVRSYVLSSQKHGVNPTQALTMLFKGQLPDYCSGYVKGKVEGAEQLHHNNKPVSCATLSVSEYGARIDNVATRTDYRRRGFGRAITLFAMEKAKELDHQMICLEASDEGLRLYLGIGFVEAYKNKVYAQRQFKDQPK